MTDPLFFDTDCLSAFLWARGESLLAQLYPGRVVIPRAVYAELSDPGIAHLKARVDTMLAAGQAVIAEIDVGTDEYDVFYKLTQVPDAGHKIIGDGEAAAIALAKGKDGIVASNNLRHITLYIEEYGLEHVTTGDILVDAYQRGLITEVEGNAIWARMIAKRRKLGAASFSDYLASKSNTAII
ncbi:MAG: hypothetical protein VB144_07705 [Clostridia bacterium]|nr:hypothetical protein [Clostridia bacterium]